MNHRGRIQSQGGGIKKSENWAKNSSLTICEGKTKLSDLKADHPKKILHTPEQFGQPADLHPDTLPELIRTASRFIFGQF